MEVWQQNQGSKKTFFIDKFQFSSDKLEKKNPFYKISYQGFTSKETPNGWVCIL